MKIRKAFKIFRILTLLIGSTAIISCSNNEAINYIVTFNPNNGNSIVSVKVESGTAISIPTDLNPTKAGFVFDGWYKDAETLIVFDFATEKVTQNTTLYAKWKAVNFQVTYNSNNGSTIASVNVESGKTISKPADPTKAGFVFDGWYKDAETLIVFDFATEKITQNTALYAKWKETFQITYNSNSGSSIASVNAESGKTISKPANPTKAGFIFDGWYKDAETLIVFDFATEKITQNTTLYARWAVTITFASIYFDLVPNYILDIPTIKTNIGIGVNLPVPTQSGWTFNGWYKDPDCTIKAITDGGLLFKTSTNIILYASWKPN